MSLMGSSSNDMIVYATASNNPYVPFFYKIKKIDGSIESTFYLNDTTIGQIAPPSYYNYKFKLISAKSPQEVYLAFSRPDKTYWGFFWFIDFSKDSSSMSHIKREFRDPSTTTYSSVNQATATASH